MRRWFAHGRRHRPGAELLDELDLAGNTLVMFSSDNGPTYDRLGGSDSEFFQSAGPLHGRKGDVDEGGIRVPLIVRWPAASPRRASQRSRLRVLGHYAHPAGSRRCGTTRANRWNQLSADAARSGRQPTHPYLVWHFPGYGGQQAVRVGHWKGVRRQLHQHPDAELQLYDLQQDLQETTDVASKHPAVVQQMLEILQQTQARSEVFGRLGQ